MNHLLSEQSIESLDSSRPGGSIPHSWWQAWVGLFVIMVVEVEILRVGWVRAGVRIGWQTLEVRLSMAGPGHLFSHSKMMSERGGGGQCCEGQRLWAVWGSWVHSRWGCRGPLNVPLWALLWDSMKNELEQIMWAIHIIALGLGLSICDMGVRLVSIHLQEVPIIREGGGQSDLTTLGTPSVGR